MINVQTLEIVPAASWMRYVTLSYVWGRSRIISPKFSFREDEIQDIMNANFYGSIPGSQRRLADNESTKIGTIVQMSSIFGFSRAHGVRCTTAVNLLWIPCTKY